MHFLSLDESLVSMAENRTICLKLVPALADITCTLKLR